MLGTDLSFYYCSIDRIWFKEKGNNSVYCKSKTSVLSLYYLCITTIYTCYPSTY